MNIYEKISWGLTGNAVKADKIFAFKPEDGEGDIVFTRESTSTRINSSGQVQNIATKIPAINWNGTKPFLSLNPARTNLLLNTTSNVSTQSVTVTAQPYTVSFYGTGTITFSGAHTGNLVGTGINDRVEVTFTPSAGSVTCSVTGTVTKGQFEAGKYASRFIPTSGSTVSRLAESVGRLANVNHLIGQTEGTIFWEGYSWADSTNKCILSISNGTDYSKISLKVDNSNKINFTCVNNSGGGTQATITSSTITSKTIYKVAGVYKGNKLALFIDGNKVDEDQSVILPAFNVISPFDEAEGSNLDFYGETGALWIAPVAISDAEAIALTRTPLEWYVRPSGGSYNLANGRTYENAFNGFSNINWSIIPDNATLYVSGTHKETLTVGKSNITIKAYPSELAIIDCEDVRNSGVIILSKTNVTLTDIISLNALVNGIYIENSTSIVTNSCEASYSGNQGFQHIGNCGVTHNNPVCVGNTDEGISSQDNGVIVVNGGHFESNAQAVHIIGNTQLTLNGSAKFKSNTIDIEVNATSNESAFLTANNCTFSSKVVAQSSGKVILNNCVLTDTLEVALATGTGYAVATNSIIAKTNYGTQGSITYTNCVLIAYGSTIPATTIVNYSKCRVFDNVSVLGVVNAEYSFFDGIGANDNQLTIQSGGRLNVKYSVFKNMFPTKFGVSIQSGAVSATTVNNCSFIGTNNVGRGIFLGQNTIVTNNNIFFDLETGFQNQTGTCTVFNSCFFDCTTAKVGTITSTGEVTGNPLFLDVTNEDFRLTAGSSCSATGKDLGLTYKTGIASATWGNVNTPPTVVTVDQETSWDIGSTVILAGGGASNVVSVSVSNGVATASFTPLEAERNKPPEISDLVVTGNSIMGAGTTLTATITGTMNGPFTEGQHEYQWYWIDALTGRTATAIPGATNRQYIIQTTDVDRYLICFARFVQVEGTNNKSEWFESLPTDIVTSAPGGGGGGDENDINHVWLDFFDIETGASIPANWNTAGVGPTLTNLGSNTSLWTASTGTSKPTYVAPSGGAKGKLVFANAHRITGVSSAIPPQWELWVKAKFTASGALLGWGSQTVFGIDTANEFQVRGMPDEPGDLNEHVFRIVMNGANSIFQVDNGPEIIFTEGMTAATTLALGQTFSGANIGDFELYRFQRTAHGTFLTSTEVEAKWAYHGF
jgi:hypothetical protein